MAKRPFSITPFGALLHAHLVTADTKFNDDGLFHVRLILEGDDAISLKDQIDKLTALDWEAYKVREGLKDKDAAKWDMHYSYEIETDDDDNETGRIIFHFKQNAKIKSRETGDLKEISIELRDGRDKPIEGLEFVGSGSKGRIMWKGRAAPQKSNKKFGIRLDFSKVQIIDLKAGSGGGFGAVDGGYEHSGSGSSTSQDDDDEGY